MSIEEREDIKKKLTESIDFNLTKESLKSISNAIIDVISNGFSRGTFNEEEYKKFKNYIEGTAEVPWEYSYHDLGAYQQLVLWDILKEVKMEKLETLLIPEEIDKQVYKKVFETMKKKRRGIE